MYMRLVACAGFAWARSAFLMDPNKGPITVFPGTFGAAFCGPQTDSVAYQDSVALVHKGLMNQIQMGLEDTLHGIGSEFVAGIKDLHSNPNLTMSEKLSSAAAAGMGGMQYAAGDLAAKAGGKVKRVSHAAVDVASKKYNEVNPYNAKFLAGAVTGKVYNVAGGIGSDISTGAHKSLELGVNVAQKLGTNAVNRGMEGVGKAFNDLMGQGIGIEDLFQGTLSTKLSKGFSQGLDDLRQVGSDVADFSKDQVTGAAWNVKAQVVDNTLLHVANRASEEKHNIMNVYHDEREKVIQEVVHA